MLLRLRNRLTLLVLLPWLAGTWWALGAPALDHDLPFAILAAAARASGWGGVAWLALMLAAMVAVDWLFCRFAAWKWGVPSSSLHWSRLRRSDGLFLCPACGSPFLLPPEDFGDEGLVHCGDCGHAVARYGEMKPYFPEIRAAYEAAFSRRLL